MKRIMLYDEKDDNIPDDAIYLDTIETPHLGRVVYKFVFIEKV